MFVCDLIWAWSFSSFKFVGNYRYFFKNNQIAQPLLKVKSDTKLPLQIIYPLNSNLPPPHPNHHVGKKTKEPALLILPKHEDSLVL